jgi:hypothetical protein
MRQLQRGPEHSPLWSPSLIKQSLFVSLNERHRYQMLRVWSEHLVLLHIRDLDERISVENACVMDS